MTLEEFKTNVYSLIEEYSEEADDLTEDEDLALKMNSCINTILNEMSRFKKIDAYTTLSVNEGDNLAMTDIASDMYQLNMIRGVDYETIQNRVLFNETGTAQVYYYKYPKQITSETEDDYKFELDTDALNIMTYGVAGLLLASDISNNYGQIYTNLYREKINTLDSRKAMPSVYLSGGINI
jgi:hypothetical protein